MNRNRLLLAAVGALDDNPAGGFLQVGSGFDGDYHRSVSVALGGGNGEELGADHVGVPRVVALDRQGYLCAFCGCVNRSGINRQGGCRFAFTGNEQIQLYGFVAIRAHFLYRDDGAYRFAGGGAYFDPRVGTTRRPCFGGSERKRIIGSDTRADNGVRLYRQLDGFRLSVLSAFLAPHEHEGQQKW